MNDWIRGGRGRGRLASSQVGMAGYWHLAGLGFRRETHLGHLILFCAYCI